VLALLYLSNFPKLADRLHDGVLALHVPARELILPGRFHLQRRFQVNVKAGSTRQRRLLRATRRAASSAAP